MSEQNPNTLHKQTKDLTGQRFGKLTVFAFAGYLQTLKCKEAFWLCQCDCGNQTTAKANYLLMGDTRSCGCRSTDQTKNLTGRRFSRWTVLQFKNYRRGKTGRSHGYWICQCNCGNIAEVRGSALLNGSSLSCGCLQKESTHTLFFQHGMSLDPTYRIWHGMIQRCYNANHQSFHHYGGRGIIVCQQWRDSFIDFLADIGNRPSPKHTLERVNNNGNYEPGNTVWAKRFEQHRNTRSNVWITHNGETLCLQDWANKLGRSPNLIKYRLKHGWSIEKALNTPPLNNGHRKSHSMDCLP